MLVVNRALGHRRRTALMTALGSASGLLVWGIASAVGIAAIFRVSATAFTAVRLAGAAYLVVLGLQAIRRARQHAAESARAPSLSLTERRQPPPRQRFRQGLLTNLLNPKAGAFFVAVLPQFIGVGESVLATTLFFATLDAGIAMLALSLYTMVALGAGRCCAGRPRVARSIASAVRS